MVSSDVALTFLSHIGFSRSDACCLMHQCHDDMSRLMICSSRELAQYDLALHQRIRLLRAIRCFHMETWSKYLMNQFPQGKHRSSSSRHQPFENLIYHLLKYHPWMVYTSWSLEYVRKFSRVTDAAADKEQIQAFHDKLHRTRNAIVQLKQTLALLEARLA